MTAGVRVKVQPNCPGHGTEYLWDRLLGAEHERKLYIYSDNECFTNVIVIYNYKYSYYLE